MSAIPAVAGDKNAVVPFTQPLHNLVLYLLHLIWLYMDNKPGNEVDEERMST